MQLSVGGVGGKRQSSFSYGNHTTLCFLGAYVSGGIERGYRTPGLPAGLVHEEDDATLVERVKKIDPGRTIIIPHPALHPREHSKCGNPDTRCNPHNTLTMTSCHAMEEDGEIIASLATCSKQWSPAVHRNTSKRVQDPKPATTECAAPRAPPTARTTADCIIYSPQRDVSSRMFDLLVSRSPGVDLGRRTLPVRSAVVGTRTQKIFDSLLLRRRRHLQQKDGPLSSRVCQHKRIKILPRKSTNLCNTRRFGSPPGSCAQALRGSMSAEVAAGCVASSLGRKR